MEPGEVKASLDRFEGDYAVVYSDDGRKFDVARALLPKRARQGARLKLTISENGKVTSVSIDREGEKELKKKIREKLARIKRGEHL